jgi:hypothetical protein
MSMNPNNDMVAEAWVAGVTGLSAAMVATNLPQDNSTWAVNGFVTVSVVGGSPDLYLPVRKPVVQVDAWAVNPNSGRAPWWKANYLAELIRAHVEAGAATYTRQVILTGKGDYRNAVVFEAILRTEPRRAIAQGMMPTGDEASYARYMLDLELAWRVAT